MAQASNMGIPSPAAASATVIAALLGFGSLWSYSTPEPAVGALWFPSLWGPSWFTNLKIVLLTLSFGIGVGVWLACKAVEHIRPPVQVANQVNVSSSHYGAEATSSASVAVRDYPVRRGRGRLVSSVVCRLTTSYI